MRTSLSYSLIAVFAAFNVVCDSIMGIPQYEGVWFSWIFVAAPITGILLGPSQGFLATLIGALAGHSIYFRGTHEFFFTLGAPIGAWVTGEVYRGRWKMPFFIYAVLLGGYFLTPVSWQLPIWGIWNVLLAFSILLVTAFLLQKRLLSWKSKKTFLLPISVLIGLEADVLFRVFLLIPCQTYRLLEINVETLIGIWTSAALITPIQVAIAIFASIVIIPPIEEWIPPLEIY